MTRQNKRRSVAGSVKSGRSSISTLTHLENSWASTVSAITMDDELASCYDRSTCRKSFGPKLRSMPEQQRASDPDMKEVQEYLDALRVASNDDSNNRFSSSAGDDMCQCPRRKSSSSQLDYRSAHSQSINSYLLTVDDDGDGDGAGDKIADETDGIACSSSKPLHYQGGIESFDPFNSGLTEEDDEAFPLSFTSPLRTSRMKGRGSYGIGMSSISMDLDDVFGESSSTPNIFAETSSPSVDVSPQVAKRRSSITCSSSTDRSAPRRLTVNLLADSQDFDESKLRLKTDDSRKNRLQGSDRFETRCPKEKSNLIPRPARRVSAYTLNLRPVAYATCMQG